MKLLFSLFICLASHLVIADGASYGISVSCSPDKKVFLLQSTELTELDFIGVDMRQELKELSEAGHYFSGNHKKACVIDDNRIEIEINISPPQPRGACGGVEYITLSRFKFNNKYLVIGVPFNHACHQSASVIKIFLDNNEWRIKECYRAGGSESEEKCETTDLAKKLKDKDS